MRDIGVIELSRMQSTFLFQDDCQILTYSPTYDSYNDPVDGYITGSSQSCEYDARGSSERRTFELTQVHFDASLRFPTGTVIDERDLVRVNTQFGLTANLPDYGVVGRPMYRPTHVFVLLEEVHT